MSEWERVDRQVLQNGRHFAEAVGEIEAMMIVNALRALGDHRGGAVRHAVHQQNDEMTCSCGARWPVGEDHP